MRRLFLGCVILCSCVKDNPAWDGSSGAGGSDGGAATAADDPTTGATPTTTGADGATTDAGATSLPELTATATSGETGTGDPTAGDASTAGTTGESLVPDCAASSWLRLEIADADLRDAGVVPTTMGTPCPWRPEFMDCADLNFGTTGFFRLVNDVAGGKSAALLRFPEDLVAARIAEAGKTLDDLIAMRVELVVWEQKPQPDGPFTLELGLLHEEDWTWDEGDHDAQPADKDDSRWGCRDIEGQCEPWALGDALAGSSKLGDLVVTPGEAMAHDIDQAGDQYHAQLQSEPLAPALIDAYRQGGAPGLTVTIASPRGLDTGDVGIKLRESDWAAPALWAELCDEWR
jgi:hypothetical protein